MLQLEDVSSTRMADHMFDVGQKKGNKVKLLNVKPCIKISSGEKKAIYNYRIEKS